MHCQCLTGSGQHRGVGWRQNGCSPFRPEQGNTCRWQQLLYVLQVTVMTPLRENACSSPFAPSPPIIRINELGLAGGGTVRFVELEGRPGTSLAGLSLIVFKGQEGKVQHSILLRGSIGASGLLLLGGEHGEAGSGHHVGTVRWALGTMSQAVGTTGWAHTRDVHPLIPLTFPGGTELMFEDISAASEGISAIALYSTSLFPGGMKATSEDLVDAVVFTCRPSTVGGHLDFLGPLYAVPCGYDR